MKITVEDLKKVKLEEGEILIIHYDENKMNDVTMENDLLLCQQIFDKNKVIFVPKHMELSVITPEMIDKLSS